MCVSMRPKGLCVNHRGHNTQTTKIDRRRHILYNIYIFTFIFITISPIHYRVLLHQPHIPRQYGEYATRLYEGHPRNTHTHTLCWQPNVGRAYIPPLICLLSCVVVDGGRARRGDHHARGGSGSDFVLFASVRGS